MEWRWWEFRDRERKRGGEMKLEAAIDIVVDRAFPLNFPFPRAFLASQGAEQKACFVSKRERELKKVKNGGQSLRWGLPFQVRCLVVYVGIAVGLREVRKRKPVANVRW